MQQKYRDQGRSTELFTTTWPICRARRSWGTGGRPRHASILPSSNSSTGVGDLLVTQWISLTGSSPICAAMTDTNRCSLAPSAVTPTVLPFRSAMLLMPSFPNNSKQPTCTPARTVTAPPPSITDTHCGAKCKLKSTSSRTTASLIAAVDALSTYRISVKPSARSRSSTISWGAWQIDGVRIKRTEVVSGGPSSASASGGSTRPTTPAIDMAVKKRRRVWIIGIKVFLSLLCRSRFQFAFELVQEPPISVLGDDLLRGRFGQTGFVKA